MYGIQANEPMKETLPLHPSSPYAVSKAAGDLYLRMMFNSFELNGTILRPTNSYGRKFDTSFMIEYLVTQMLKGKKIYIGSPDSVRDYMYVDDHVNAYMLAMKNPKANGQVYNVGTTIGVSNKELAMMIAKKIGFDMKNIVIGFLSAWLSVSSARFPISRPSCWIQRRLRRNWSWTPTVTLSEGLDKVISYFQEH